MTGSGRDRVRLSGKFIIFHFLNIRNVKQNCDRYISALGGDDTHVIILTEPWLDPSSGSTFNIPRYDS